MDALQIKNLSKKFGNTTALKSVNLNIQTGEFFGLLGKNGAGKTTTINCVTGITNFSEGEIKVFDANVVSQYRKARKFIGVSPQEFNVDIFATTEKILGYVGGYFGMTKKQRTEKIDELVEEFNFSEHIKKPFRFLSGGLKRRAVLMRALVHDPQLLILDEPTAGVDIEQRHQLWDYLKKLHKKNITIILTSHYLEEVEILCSRVGILNDGQIAKIVNSDQYMGEHQSLEKIYLDITKTKTDLL